MILTWMFSQSHVWDLPVNVTCREFVIKMDLKTIYKITMILDGNSLTEDFFAVVLIAA